MRSRSILIMTSGPLCRNPRPLKECLALGAAGYAVQALTVFESVSTAAIDRELIGDSGVTLRTIYPPRDRLRRSAAKLTRWIARRAAHLHTGLAAATFGPSRALWRSARSVAADLTIAHNEAPLWAARRLLRSGQRVAADFEDWYSEDLLPDARRHRPIWLLRELEKELLHSAAYCTTTSRSLADALAEKYTANAPHVILNAFPLQSAPSLTVQSPPRLVWFSQTIGPGRGLEAFLAWWASAPPEMGTVTLIGTPARGYTEALSACIPPAARNRLTFAPVVKPTELPDVLARFDIGLALERCEPPSRDLTITNKILQYTNAGLAVLATPTAGQREVLEQAPGAGEFFVPGNRAALERCQRLISDPTQLTRARIAARAAAERTFNWEHQSRLFLDLVNHVLSIDHVAAGISPHTVL